MILLLQGLLLNKASMEEVVVTAVTAELPLIQAIQMLSTVIMVLLVEWLLGL